MISIRHWSTDTKVASVLAAIGLIVGALFWWFPRSPTDNQPLQPLGPDASPLPRDGGAFQSTVRYFVDGTQFYESPIVAEDSPVMCFDSSFVSERQDAFACTTVIGTDEPTLGPLSKEDVEARSGPQLLRDPCFRIDDASVVCAKSSSDYERLLIDGIFREDSEVERGLGIEASKPWALTLSNGEYCSREPVIEAVDTNTYICFESDFVLARTYLAWLEYDSVENHFYTRTLFVPPDSAKQQLASVEILSGMRSGTMLVARADPAEGLNTTVEVAAAYF